MTQAEKPNETVTIDGRVYNITELPQQVVGLLHVFQTWHTELNAQRLETSKTELAIRSLTADIKAAVEASGVEAAGVVPEAQPA